MIGLVNKKSSEFKKPNLKKQFLKINMTLLFPLFSNLLINVDHEQNERGTKLI